MPTVLLVLGVAWLLLGAARIDVLRSGHGQRIDRFRHRLPGPAALVQPVRAAVEITPGG